MYDLKPCPFCGGEARLNDYQAQFGDLNEKYRNPICKDCGCNLGYFPTADRASKVWNTRAAMTAPQVKPLVWIECSDGTHHDEHCQYELEIDGLFLRVTRGVTGGTSYVANADTLEAAKAAAQADYEARIRSALTTEGEG